MITFSNVLSVYKAKNHVKPCFTASAPRNHTTLLGSGCTVDGRVHTVHVCVCVLGAHRHPIKDAVALHSTASDSTEIMSDFLGG